MSNGFSWCLRRLINNLPAASHGVSDSCTIHDWSTGGIFQSHWGVAFSFKDTTDCNGARSYFVTCAPSDDLYEVVPYILPKLERNIAAHQPSCLFPPVLIVLLLILYNPNNCLSVKRKLPRCCYHPDQEQMLHSILGRSSSLPVGHFPSRLLSYFKKIYSESSSTIDDCLIHTALQRASNSICTSLVMISLPRGDTHQHAQCLIMLSGISWGLFVNQDERDPDRHGF